LLFLPAVSFRLGPKIRAGLNKFTISSKKWIEQTNATGLVSKAGRYGGGTYAHKAIAFEFGSKRQLSMYSVELYTLSRHVIF
jgi:hypothetical protein